MNLPNNDKAKSEIPEEAKGNPVYEQTRQDMPLWCCGRNCGRNTRIVVLSLAIIGIGCSLWACLSVKYFSFVSLRNDTFLDPEKTQPAPFEYATEANVGLFKYEILEVFIYPWPPEGERRLFDEMLLDELRRMQDNATDAPPDTLGGGALDVNATDGSTAAPTTKPCTEVVEPGPGSVKCGVTASPTTAPSFAPTPININDIIAETVDIGVVKPYPDGIGMFDSSFTNAQRGAIMGPVFAFLGVVFGMIELCCCTYKCSWLPTALFLYLAFMFQLFTMFLFLSEDWCKYDQECALGNAGFGSVIAVICYMFAQSLVCCSPRPPPFFNCCKKKPVRRKKKKKTDPNEEEEGLNRNPDDDDEDGFRDEPGYVDPYDDATQDDYDYGGDSYMEPSQQGGYPTEDENDAHSAPYDNDTYANDTYGDGTYDDDGTRDQSYDGDEAYDDGNYEDGGESYYTEDDGAEYDSQYDSQSGYSNDKRY